MTGARGSASEGKYQDAIESYRELIRLCLVRYGKSVLVDVDMEGVELHEMAYAIHSSTFDDEMVTIKKKLYSIHQSRPKRTLRVRCDEISRVAEEALLVSA